MTALTSAMGDFPKAVVNLGLQRDGVHRYLRG
jgi:hypothetical protein